MPIYEYKAMNPSGRSTKGTIDADTPKTARSKLKKQGLLVTELQESKAGAASAGGSIPLFSGAPSQKEVTFMTRQLASLVKANIPLVDCLRAVAEQSEHPILRKVLTEVHDDVNEGSSLNKALLKHQGVFDTIFINMVDAGESSGTLGHVLLRMADLKESQMRLRGKVQSAMTYPIIMMGMASLLMIVIFAFVIPKFVDIFKSMGKELPPVTKFLINVSGFLTNWWWAMLGALILFIVYFRKTLRTEQGVEKWDRFKLKVPVLGPLIRTVAVNRFASTLSTLLSSGVPIIAAMNIAKNLVGNRLIEKAIDSARNNITEGQSIAEPLRRSGEFPSMVIHMISIGEKTGELPEMLKNVSETYEEQVQQKIEQMTSMLEPLMIVGMALVVAFIVAAIFIPMLDMSDIQG